MGAWINPSAVLTISDKTFSNGIISEISYKDINSHIKKLIQKNKEIQIIQINQPLPEKAFKIIDDLLKIRPDITFRIFGLMKGDDFDLDVLFNMKYLTKLRLEAHLVGDPHIIDSRKLCKLENLKELSLNIFDLKDYSFIQNLNPNIEKLVIMADTMKGTPVFDCQWLLKFSKLHTLALGQKAKKNLKLIAKMPSLKALSIRGIKINDFFFLQNSSLESLSVLWCSVSDFNSLKVLKNLKYLELWRILKLDDISVISSLEKLETIKLQDLRHINQLPDISHLKNLKKIELINMSIDQTNIPDNIEIIKW